MPHRKTATGNGLLTLSVAGSSLGDADYIMFSVRHLNLQRVRITRGGSEKTGFCLAPVTNRQHGDIVGLFGSACMCGDVFAQCSQHIRNGHIVSGGYARKVRL